MPIKIQRHGDDPIRSAARHPVIEPPKEGYLDAVPAAIWFGSSVLVHVAAHTGPSSGHCPEYAFFVAVGVEHFHGAAP